MLTGGPDLHLFAPLPLYYYLHRLRSLWRGAQFRVLQQRRPHFAGLAYHDIHTKLLRKWIQQLSHQRAALATTARLLLCDAYRPAAWLNHHQLVAGEPRFSMQCPN